MEPPPIAGNVVASLKNSLEVPQNVRHREPYNPASLLLGVYPQAMQTYVHAKPRTQCSQQHSLLITAKTSKITQVPIN